LFTGDRSGNWLYAALHRARFCNQAESASLNDHLELSRCSITCICHCAPPDNKPNREEIQNCADWLHQTIQLCRPLVFLALGSLAWQALVRYGIARNWLAPPKPEFTHGRQIELAGEIFPRWLLASYHPSQQNTFTGRLTEKMLDEILDRAKNLINGSDLSQGNGP
jgi:uracil-DNA glycosylase family 4